MSLSTNTQTIAGTVAPRRSLRTTIALSAAAAAVAATTLPAFAMTPNASVPGLPSSFTEPLTNVVPFTYQDLITSADTFSIDAIINNEAVFRLHAWQLLPNGKSVG